MKELVKSTKGTVRHYGDDSLEFTPYGKGEPVYDHSHKVGAATLGLTKGTGKQNYIAHLKCSADEADPFGKLQDQLEKLAAREWPEKKLMPVKPRTKILLNADGKYVSVDEKKKVLSLHLDIDLSEDCECVSKISNFVIETHQCLYINQDLLRRVCLATGKPSKQ